VNQEHIRLFNELQLLHNRVCRAIGDPKRLMILYALAEGPRYVVELAEELDYPQPTVSRHLNALFQGGLVIKERQGQSVYYSLSDERIIQALDLMRGLLRDRTEAQARLAAGNAVYGDE
jgi:ArsR family transcriptional regulator